jgi:hypothetical protein
MRELLRIRTRRVVVAVAIALTSVVGGVGPLQTPPTASAMVIGPQPIPAGGLHGATVACDAYRQVRISINAAVQTGYTSGQLVRVRYYWHDGVNAVWSSWMSARVPYNGYRPAVVFDRTFRNLRAGGDHRVWVEWQWYDGSRWTNHRGLWAQRGQAGWYYIDWNGHCRT